MPAHRQVASSWMCTLTSLSGRKNALLGSIKYHIIFSNEGHVVYCHHGDSFLYFFYFYPSPQKSINTHSKKNRTKASEELKLISYNILKAEHLVPGKGDEQWKGHRLAKAKCVRWSQLQWPLAKSNLKLVIKAMIHFDFRSRFKFQYFRISLLF